MLELKHFDLLEPTTLFAVSFHYLPPKRGYLKYWFLSPDGETLLKEFIQVTSISISSYLIRQNKEATAYLTGHGQYRNHLAKPNVNSTRRLPNIFSYSVDT